MKKIFILIITTTFILIIVNESYCQTLKRVWSKGGINGFRGLEQIAFSQDEKYLMTTGNNGGVQVWNTVKGGYEYKIQPGKLSYSTALSFSTDGERIVFGTFSELVLYNYQTHSIEKSIEGYYRHPTFSKYSNSGKFIALSTNYEPSRIYDVENSKFTLLPTWKLPVFSSDNKYYAYIERNGFGSDTNIVIHSISDNNTTTKIANIYPDNAQVDFLQDDLIVYYHNNIYYYETENFSLLKKIKVDFKQLKYSQDGNYVVIVDSNNVASLNKASNYEKMYNFDIDLSESFNISIDISSKNNYIAILKIDSSNNKFLQSFELNTGKKLWKLNEKISASQYVNISPDNKYILTSSLYGGLSISKLENGEQIKIINDYNSSGKRGFRADFSSDSIHFAFSHFKNDNYIGDVYLYNLKDLEKSTVIQLGGHGANCVKFSPDGKYLLMGMNDYSVNTGYYINAYNLETRQISSVGNVWQKPSSINFSGNNKRFAVGTDDWYLYVFGFDGSYFRREFRNWESYNIINNVCLNYDGSIVFAANYNGTVRSWEVDSNKLFHSYYGSESSTYALSLTSDGNTIIGGSYDGKIRFWDVYTSKLKYVSDISETGLIIRDLSISTDEKYLVIGDALNDGIMLFTLDLNSEVKQLISNDLKYFQISPNPASDFIEINLNIESSPIASEKVQIFDILGVEVMNVVTGLDLSTQRIDISHLPTGVYFIRIGNRVEKFVKSQY